METKIFDIIRAGINVEVIQNLNVKEDELGILKEQSLLQFLYPVTKNLEYRTYYISASIVNEKFNRMQAEIRKVMEEKNIDFFYFKGTILKSFYTDPALRTRGDIDFYVKPEEYKKALYAMVEPGNFKAMDNDLTDYHLGMRKDGLFVEVHQALMSVKSPYYEFFSKPMEHIFTQSGNLCFLDNTYHLLYVIAHFAKHFIQGGAGIRPIID